MPMPSSLGSVFPALDRREEYQGRASSARQPNRPLRARRAGRAARPRPRRASRAALTLLTLGARLPRSACVTTNTEAVLAVQARLASYARQSLITTWPFRALRALHSDGTALSLDASTPTQARRTLRSYKRLNDDLDRP